VRPLKDVLLHANDYQDDEMMDSFAQAYNETQSGGYIRSQRVRKNISNFLLKTRVVNQQSQQQLLLLINYIVLSIHQPRTQEDEHKSERARLYLLHLAQQHTFIQAHLQAIILNYHAQNEDPFYVVATKALVNDIHSRIVP
jgi:hypothetical protein